MTIEQYDNGVKIIGTYLCDPQMIDRDNYEILIDNGYYTEKEVEPDPTETPTPESVTPTEAALTPTEKPVTPTPEAVTPTETPEPTEAPERFLRPPTEKAKNNIVYTKTQPEQILFRLCFCTMDMETALRISHGR